MPEGTSHGFHECDYKDCHNEAAFHCEDCSIAVCRHHAQMGCPDCRKSMEEL